MKVHALLMNAMNIKVGASGLLVILMLAGCAGHKASEATHSTTVTRTKPQAKNMKVSHPPILLERMDSSFLYLSAQQAEANQQPLLAIRFLKALIKKEPDAMTPRFELVDLLLASGQQKHALAAKQYMQDIPQSMVEHLETDDLLTYQQLYARSLIAVGEIKEAARHLSDILRHKPERIEVRLMLARLYAVNKNYDAAHQVVQDGLKLHQDVRLQQLQVQLHVQQGKLKAADALLARMQKDAPDHENSVLQRAHLAEKQGQNVKAESLLLHYIHEHEKTALQSYAMLAGLYVRQNRLDAAIMMYERLLPLVDNGASVLMSLGKLYYQQQKFKQASTYFEQAVARLSNQGGQGIHEELATAHFYYAASLEASHQWQKAVPEYQILKPEHGLYLDAQLRLASIDISQKQLDAAEARLLKLQTSFKDSLPVYEVLSGLRLQQKRYRDVIDESEKATDLGYSYTLLFNRAIAFEKLKDYVRLDATLNAILAKDPDDAEVLNFYGYSLADRGVRLQDAQTMVEKALSIRPDDGYYLDSLAWVLYKRKEYEKALKLQLDAVRLIQDDPVMMEHLGDIYWKNHDAKQARASWQKAIDSGHDEPEKVKLKIKRGLL